MCYWSCWVAGASSARIGAITPYRAFLELSVFAECRNEQIGAAEGISRPSPSPCFDWQVDCGRRKDATMGRSSLVSVALSSQHGAPAPSTELQSRSVVSTECGRGGVSYCI